jgi:uncharacterized protein
MAKKYLDTYVLVEIAQGNPTFAGYLSQEYALSDLTLSEFYYVLLRDQGEEPARMWYERLKHYSEPTDLEALIDAMKFRYDNRKRHLSVMDAAGYVHARRNGCVFVTGDKEFEDVEGVEFVK